MYLLVLIISMIGFLILGIRLLGVAIEASIKFIEFFIRFCIIILEQIINAGIIIFFWITEKIISLGEINTPPFTENTNNKNNYNDSFEQLKQNYYLADINLFAEYIDNINNINKLEDIKQKIIHSHYQHLYH